MDVLEAVQGEADRKYRRKELRTMTEARLDSRLAIVSQKIISEDDMPSVLALITRYATELLNAHSCVMMLRDKNGREAKYVSVYNVTSELLGKKYPAKKA